MEEQSGAMADMVISQADNFGGIYKDKNVLVTGHTGFKGSWLVFWLKMMGAKVTCLALTAESDPNHWDVLCENECQLKEVESRTIDINDLERLRSYILSANPEIIFHLAAQSLVRESYDSPLQTWATNVMGTANILEICRDLTNLKAVICATTDKCYENTGKTTSYSEGDPLGGHDPYSASKASAEILISSYRRSFFKDNLNSKNNALIASVRAGNVIGGGDWSENRLIPDAMRSFYSNAPLKIRAPKATRPWQHVLDCLSGYLLLGQRLLNKEEKFADAWNFGPSSDSVRSVQDVLLNIKKTLDDMNWEVDEAQQFHESAYLTLNSAKAHDVLNWKPVWDVDQAIHKTALWYKSFYEENVIDTKAQLESYIEDARHAQLNWASS